MFHILFKLTVFFPFTLMYLFFIPVLICNGIPVLFEYYY